MFDLWKDSRPMWARQADRYRSNGKREPVHWFQRAYHRDFEAFTEVTELDARGRQVIRRIYTGKYFEPALDVPQRVRLRLVYVLCFLSGTALFLFCATRALVYNRTFYAAIIQCATVLILLWHAVALVFYLPATGKLTIGAYRRQHTGLVNTSRAAAVSMWVAAAAAVLNTALHFGEDALRALLCAAGFAASGLPLFLVSYLESHLNYNVTDSGNEGPLDGFDIE